jgi:hypothetical protein
MPTEKNLNISIESQLEFEGKRLQPDTPTHDLTDIERMARERYPDEEGASMMRNIGIATQRNAYIDCARQYIDKVKGLEAERDAWKDASQLYFKYLSPETKEIIKQYYQQAETHSQTNKQQP